MDAIDGDKKEPVGVARFRWAEERRVVNDRAEKGKREENERTDPFTGKMAEKLGEFQFHFERTPPHRPVWTLAGLSFVAVHHPGTNGNEGAIVMGVLLVSRAVFHLDCNIDMDAAESFIVSIGLLLFSLSLFSFVKLISRFHGIFLMKAAQLLDFGYLGRPRLRMKLRFK